MTDTYKNLANKSILFMNNFNVTKIEINASKEQFSLKYQKYQNLGQYKV